MAVVLVLRPWGLLGRPQAHGARHGDVAGRRSGRCRAARRVAAWFALPSLLRCRCSPARVRRSSC